jgi:hypothetical protein
MRSWRARRWVFAGWSPEPPPQPPAAAVAAPLGLPHLLSTTTLACTISPSLQVYLVSSQEQVAITSLWAPEERAVLAFGRHMG